jgi:hypothetical protein
VEVVTYDQAIAHTIAAGDLILPSRQKSGWGDQVTQVIGSLRGKAAQYLSIINHLSLHSVAGPG